MQQQAKKLVQIFIEQCQQQFLERILAIYTLGSLGEHGDFSSCSDVDMALILDELTATDAEQVRKLWDHIHTMSIPYADRLSVFWSCPKNFSQGKGRFPALDRLDLIKHGTLQYGVDCRSQLQKPMADEIILESGHFLVDFMLTPEKQQQLLNNRQQIGKQGARYFSKFVLFSVRLLYTIDHPEEIASNEQAVDYFVKHHEGAIAELVSFAYQCRELAPDEVVSVKDTLLNNLLELYQECIKSYRIRLFTRHAELAQTLSTILNTIAKAKGEINAIC